MLAEDLFVFVLGFFSWQPALLGKLRMLRLVFEIAGNCVQKVSVSEEFDP